MPGAGPRFVFQRDRRHRVAAQVDTPEGPLLAGNPQSALRCRRCQVTRYPATRTRSILTSHAFDRCVWRAQTVLARGREVAPSACRALRRLRGARACNECSFSPTSSSQAPDAGFPLASKQALRALNQTLFFSLILWSQVTNPRSFPFFPVSEANYIS